MIVCQRKLWLLTNYRNICPVLNYTMCISRYYFSSFSFSDKGYFNSCVKFCCVSARQIYCFSRPVTEVLPQYFKLIAATAILFVVSLELRMHKCDEISVLHQLSLSIWTGKSLAPKQKARNHVQNRDISWKWIVGAHMSIKWFRQAANDERVRCG